VRGHGELAVHLGTEAVARGVVAGEPAEVGAHPCLDGGVLLQQRAAVHREHAAVLRDIGSLAVARLEDARVADSRPEVAVALPVLPALVLAQDGHVRYVEEGAEVE
jgi:hypothetical protein